VAQLREDSLLLPLNATLPATLQTDDDRERLTEGDGDDESLQDGSLSRCHSRSVSHDSYFRLLVTNRISGNQVDPVNEEGSQENSEASQSGKERLLGGDHAIYAEISKPGTKSKLFKAYLIYYCLLTKIILK